MSVKIKAALITVGILISSFIVVIILNHLPTWVVGVIALAFAAWIMYTLALAQLEFNRKVDEISERYKDKE